MIVLMIPMMMAVTPAPLVVMPSANILVRPLEPQKSSSVAMLVPTPAVLVANSPHSLYSSAAINFVGRESQTWRTNTEIADHDTWDKAKLAEIHAIPPLLTEHANQRSAQRFQYQGRSLGVY
jgi:hypothetical protein